MQGPIRYDEGYFIFYSMVFLNELTIVLKTHKIIINIFTIHSNMINPTIVYLLANGMKN